MGEILMKAATFIGIILLGIILRKTGFFKEEDFPLFSRLVIKITLTAAVVSSFAGRDLDPSMLFLTVIGFVSGVFFICLALFTNRKRGKPAQVFAMLNQTGFNIGTFGMPFAQGFLGPVGIMAVSVFDVGNAVIVLGTMFTVGSVILQGRESLSVKRIVKAICSSAPLMAYLIMICLSALHIRLPSLAVNFASTIGNANAFLAMLMIGIGFKIKGDRSQFLLLFRLLGVRYLVAGLLAVCGFVFLPIPLEYRQALVIALLSPIPAVSPAYTEALDGDTGLSCVINSLSMVISITLMTLACFVIL